MDGKLLLYRELKSMITSYDVCPFCGSHLINEDRCQSCHAFQIKGYVSREARKRINFVSISMSVLVVLFGALIVFVISKSIGAYISVIACSLAVYFIMKKILIIKEVKKGKVVWKREIITW
ncbi:hypothetical protein [Klebsiella variicola]|uniref:hypothetical protein n=1 Tax=Klebsiella variicola TaxID=244366 RepID=UPI0020C72AAA|nr:hypothetical protein [Klebsiella variicola]